MGQAREACSPSPLQGPERWSPEEESVSYSLGPVNAILFGKRVFAYIIRGDKSILSHPKTSDSVRERQRDPR